MTATTFHKANFDAIKSLLNSTVDAKEGFDVMVEKAEPAFRPVAQKFQRLHAAHAAQLSLILSSNAEDPSTAGTLMGSINEAVVSIRALFDEIDDDVMDSVRRGEKSVLSAFDDALDKATPELRDDLAKMRSDLQALLDETAHLD